MVAGKIATLPQGARTDLAPIGAMSQDGAADMLNVGRRSVQRIQARALRRCGELLKQIEPAPGARTDLGQAPTRGSIEMVESGTPMTRREAAQAAGLSEHQRKTALRVANVSDAIFTEQVVRTIPTATSRAQAPIGADSLPGQGWGEIAPRRRPLRVARNEKAAPMSAGGQSDAANRRLRAHAAFRRPRIPRARGLERGIAGRPLGAALATSRTVGRAGVAVAVPEHVNHVRVTAEGARESRRCAADRTPAIGIEAERRGQGDDAGAHAAPSAISASRFAMAVARSSSGPPSSALAMAAARFAAARSTSE